MARRRKNLPQQKPKASNKEPTTTAEEAKPSNLPPPSSQREKTCDQNFAPRTQALLLSWSPCLVSLMTFALRVHHVMDPSSWWVLHPDEIYQSMEVAHSELYGYGLRPYEFNPAPKGNNLSHYQLRELTLGMYALRSPIMPQYMVMVTWLAHTVGLDTSNPYLTFRLAHIAVTSILPLAVSKFAHAASGCPDVASLAAILTGASAYLNIMGSHTLVNSFVSPALFLGLARAVNVLRTSENGSSKQISGVRKNEILRRAGIVKTSCTLNSGKPGQFYSSSPNNYTGDKEKEIPKNGESDVKKSNISIQDGITSKVINPKSEANNNSLKENLMLSMLNNESLSYGKQEFEQDALTHNVPGIENAQKACEKHNAFLFQTDYNGSHYDNDTEIRCLDPDISGIKLKNNLANINCKWDDVFHSSSTGDNTTSSHDIDNISTDQNTITNCQNQITSCLADIISGFLLTLAIYIRPDCVLLALAVLLGNHRLTHTPALLYNKQTWRLALGGVVGLVLAASNDVIFYGDLVLSPLNWVRLNVLSGTAARLFGVSGWTFYLRRVFLHDVGMCAASLVFSAALLVCVGRLMALKLHFFSVHVFPTSNRSTELEQQYESSSQNKSGGPKTKPIEAGDDKSNQTQNVERIKNNMCYLTHSLIVHVVCVAGTTALYSCMGHKEERFLHDSVVIFMVAVSEFILLAVDFIQTKTDNRLICTGNTSKRKLGHITVMLSGKRCKDETFTFDRIKTTSRLFSPHNLRFLTITVLSSFFLACQIHTFRTSTTAHDKEWLFSSSAAGLDTSRCLHFLSTQKDVTGVFIERGIQDSGGYSLLHKNVPLVYLLGNDFVEFTESLAYTTERKCALCNDFSKCNSFGRSLLNVLKWFTGSFRNNNGGGSGGSCNNDKDDSFCNVVEEKNESGFVGCRGSTNSKNGYGAAFEHYSGSVEGSKSGGRYRDKKGNFVKDDNGCEARYYNLNTVSDLIHRDNRHALLRKIVGVPSFPPRQLSQHTQIRQTRSEKEWSNNNQKQEHSQLHHQQPQHQSKQQQQQQHQYKHQQQQGNQQHQHQHQQHKQQRHQQQPLQKHQNHYHPGQHQDNQRHNLNQHEESPNHNHHQRQSRYHPDLPRYNYAVIQAGKQFLSPAFRPVYRTATLWVWRRVGSEHTEARLLHMLGYSGRQGGNKSHNHGYNSNIIDDIDDSSKSDDNNENSSSRRNDRNKCNNNYNDETHTPSKKEHNPKRNKSKQNENSSSSRSNSSRNSDRIDRDIEADNNKNLYHWRSNNDQNAIHGQNNSHIPATTLEYEGEVLKQLGNYWEALNRFTALSISHNLSDKVRVSVLSSMAFCLHRLGAQQEMRRVLVECMASYPRDQCLGGGRPRVLNLGKRFRPQEEG